MNNRPLDEERIFHMVRKLRDPVDRDDFLDQICGGDQALHQRIVALLQVHEREPEFLKSSSQLAPTVSHSPLTEQPGTLIGRYRLMERIGEGGMGAVFVAEQGRPIRRKVALKVIKPGMDTASVIARFEAERQALAVMDHPNIAKVFDAGTTDEGRPYFVMELVSGIDITRYCDEYKLTISERLELFASVCQAIQHAHQKGIIHRDIKPSNVLVTEQDGKAVAKVIDFGIAKAVGRGLTDRTVYTSFQTVIGTPLYMSPEQAALSNVDVDTRSDVYSLGVLLYELLTGCTPFDQELLKNAAQDEVLRIIREQDPLKPSTKISTLGERATAISRGRRTDAVGLGRAVRGDLDWIVMKALDKDRARRYDTAIGLAADIRRFLNNEPVEARAPSPSYRVKKFIDRNRIVVTVATLILSLIVVSLVGMIILLQEIYTKQQRLTDLLHEYRNQQIEAGLMLAFSGQMEQMDVIAARLERILTELDRNYQPLAATSLLKGIAHFYRGEERQAREQLDLAMALDPDAIAPNAIRAVAAAYHGDWAAYLDNVPKLSSLKIRMPLDEVFLWYGKLYVDPRVAAEELRVIISRDSESVFGQALTAAALAHAAIDTGDRRYVEEALVRVDRAERLAEDSPLVNLMSLYAHDAAIQLAKLENDDTTELIKKADVRAARLASNNEFLVGRYEVALYLERNGRSNEARPHWRACGMVRDACAVFERDGALQEAWEYLDAQQDSRYVRLTRLILQIGTRPQSEILADYKQLIRREPDVAFRIDALEVPLRLGVPDVAREEATRLLQRSGEYEALGPWVIPVAAYIAGDPRGDLLEASAEDSESRYFQIHARYWIGLKQLAVGNRERARELFESCLKTGAFDYSHYGFAEAILARLKDPAWPRLPESR